MGLAQDWKGHYVFPFRAQGSDIAYNTIWEQIKITFAIVVKSRPHTYVLQSDIRVDRHAMGVSST
jgi:hypothetical protein